MKWSSKETGKVTGSDFRVVTVWKVMQSLFRESKEVRIVV